MMTTIFYKLRRLLTQLCWMTLLGAIPCIAVHGQNVPYEVVANVLSGPRTGEITRRHIFIYWEESKFDLDRIIDELYKLSDEYPMPVNLRVAIYSDREMLDRLRKYEANPVAIQFRQDEAGQKAELEYYSRVYPRRDGYFRVDYSRNRNFEFLDYNPERDSPRTQRINVKARRAGCN